MKVRIQSNRFSLIWPFLQETVKRIKSKNSFAITYNEKLPLKELDICIDAHFDCRKQLDRLRKMLED